MTTIRFLAEWALRSSILILGGAVLLRVFRVKDPAVRLAAWTAVLCGSLAIPVAATFVPAMPLAVIRATPSPLQVIAMTEASPARQLREAPRQSAPAAQPFDWAGAVAIAYSAVAGALLLRLAMGVVLSGRILRNSRATGRRIEGIEIRESEQVASPLALGIVRPAIVLPTDWHTWESAKLDAVVAHESSHIRRWDPAVQALSACHRALLWCSPLSWFLHRSIVRVAEEASDDAAVAAASDRASYAGMLLEFMQRGVRGAGWQGVAMARYQRPDERIHRILDGTSLSRGVTRWTVAAILGIGFPLAYVVTAAQPQAVTAPKPAAAPSAAASVAPAAPAAESAQQADVARFAAALRRLWAANAQTTAAHAQAAAPGQATTRPASREIRRYMIFSGDSISGSWDSRDPVDREGLRAKYGRNFAWFRQGRSEYVVTDPLVLMELQKAMEPQKKVNSMQSVVNNLQSVVNRLQSEVNQAQSRVNSLQGQVSSRQRLISGLESARGNDELIRKLEAALAELKANKGGPATQDGVNLEQAKVNAMQAHVNEEQQKVNLEQNKVNQEQHRVSAEFEGKIEEILDSAVQRHLVVQLM